MQADAFMLVPDKQRRKEIKEVNLVSVFFFFLLIFLCFSVFYSISPALAAADKEKLSIISADKEKLSIISADKDSLSVIAINGEEIYIRSGYSHNFLQNYQLYIKGTDTEGKRIWIELSRNGVSLQDCIVTEGSQFVYSNNSTEILNLTVDTIYEGADGVLVKFSLYTSILIPGFCASNDKPNLLTMLQIILLFPDPKLETQAEALICLSSFLGKGPALGGLFAEKEEK
uniref:S-layer family duplication domain-containing protein n=1 Tax=Methanosarcina barkeri TaxID=2208 RepID=Q9HH15_METBA|nr:unknown [Methanosarcina barkeri]